MTPAEWAAMSWHARARFLRRLAAREREVEAREAALAAPAPPETVLTIQSARDIAAGLPAPTLAEIVERRRIALVAVYGQADGLRRGRRVARCGTTAGYRRHRRLGQDICGRCRAAESDYRSARRAAQRQEQAS